MGPWICYTFKMIAYFFYTIFVKVTSFIYQTIMHRYEIRHVHITTEIKTIKQQQIKSDCKYKTLQLLHSSTDMHAQSN